MSKDPHINPPDARNSLLLFVSSMAFVSIGCAMLLSGRQPLVAWSGILFFGGGAAIALWDLLLPKIRRSRHTRFVTAQGEQRALVARNHIGQYILYTIGSGGVSMGSALMALSGESFSCFCWLSLLVFGPGTFLLAWNLVDRRPRLIIDTDGVFDRTPRIGTIAWDDIQSAHRQSIQGNEFISLQPRDPSIYLARMSWVSRKLSGANAALSFGVVNVRLAGVNASSEEVLHLINAYLLKHQMMRDTDL